MTGSGFRVAFAGLAHSHPSTDAANVRALGGEVVAVQDTDAHASAEFALRFGGAVVGSVEELRALRPDLVIATPRPQEVVPLLRALSADGADAPLFLNKVIAATTGQLAARDRAIQAGRGAVGTSSPLRFAPALSAFAAEVGAGEVLSIRVQAQHDNAAFQLPGRSWQDDPHLGGGTLVTVGVHAWEMLDVVLPGAELRAARGWTRRSAGSTTRSEDAAGVSGLLRVEGQADDVPVEVLVSGVPGPDAYSVELVTATGIRSVTLPTADPNESLGFHGLVRALRGAAAAGEVVAPWADARLVVANTIRAAEAARGQDPRAPEAQAPWTPEPVEGVP
ncbi:Gfo/Idh/MocA family oxidoreductase [Microbacterium saperdae]